VAKAKLAVQLQLIEILLVRDDPVVLDVKHAATADGDLTARPFQVAPRGQKKGPRVGAGEASFGGRRVADGRLVPGC
jgi:hypothetical protein